MRACDRVRLVFLYTSTGRVPAIDHGRAWRVRLGDRVACECARVGERAFRLGGCHVVLRHAFRYLHMARHTLHVTRHASPVACSVLRVHRRWHHESNFGDFPDYPCMHGGGWDISGLTPGGVGQYLCHVMNKNVAINPAYPANDAIAETVLGKVVEPVKTRWSPGALASSALSNTASPAVLVFGASFMSVSTPASPAAYVADFKSIADGLSLAATLNAFAVTGNTRSRALDFAASGISFPVALQVDDAVVRSSMNADGLIEVFAPVVQPLTASSLVGKIDSFYQDREVPLDYCGLIDQNTGEVVVFGTASAGISDSTAIRDGLLGVYAHLFMFDLTVPDPSAPVNPTVETPWG